MIPNHDLTEWLPFANCKQSSEINGSTAMSIPVESVGPVVTRREPTAQDLAKEDKKKVDEFEKLLSDARTLTEAQLDEYKKQGSTWMTEEEADLMHTAYQLRAAEEAFANEVKPEYEEVRTHSGSPEDLKTTQLQFERYSEVLEMRIDQIFNELGEPLRIIDRSEQAVLDGIARMRNLPLRA
jgi:hypothetical protein